MTTAPPRPGPEGRRSPQTMTAALPLAALLALSPLAPPGGLPGTASEDPPSPDVPVLVAGAATSVQVDGVLDEAEWEAADVATGFVQFEPTEGAAPSQRTEVRALYGGDAGADTAAASPDGAASSGTSTSSSQPKRRT